jgi:hypothetical protein
MPHSPAQRADHRPPRSVDDEHPGQNKVHRCPGQHAVAYTPKLLSSMIFSAIPCVNTRTQTHSCATGGCGTITRSHRYPCDLSAPMPRCRKVYARSLQEFCKTPATVFAVSGPNSLHKKKPRH